MGIAKLYGQSGGSGKINGIIDDYYAYAGENIAAGDFVEFINGVASSRTETSEDTQISTTAYTGYVISAKALDENRVFIAHCYTSDYHLYGIVCTIKGSKITYGTDTAISANDYSGHPAISTVVLENNKVLVVHSRGSNKHLYGAVCTISGTTITAGADTRIVESAAAGFAISAVLLSSNKVFIAHTYSSNKYLYGIVCTISGTSITVGTDTSVRASANAGNVVSAVLLPSGNVFIAHSYGTKNYLYSIVCSISGTTITVGTGTSISSEDYAGYKISAVTLLNGNVFIAHGTSQSYYLRATICTISGTTITAGNWNAISSILDAGYAISAILLSNGNVFIAHSRGQGHKLYGIVCTVSGTTITVGTDMVIYDTDYTASVISAVILPRGNVFIAHNLTLDYYLNAQVFGIDETNNIPTNNVVINEYETQVRKATAQDIYGVAKTSGTGGDSTAHNDIVSIYTIEQTTVGL